MTLSCSLGARHDVTTATSQLYDVGVVMRHVFTTDLYGYTWITAPLCFTIGRNVTRAPPFSYRKCPLATSLRAHLLILKTLLIRRDVLIKHAVQHLQCMHANNSSTTNRYQFIFNRVFPTWLCASGDVDVWRSNEQCITCCCDYEVPTIIT